jgi:hypothetical protein
MTTIREGCWDCPSCGTQGILGRHTDCTACGRSRPAGIKFYLPAQASEVADPDLQAIAKGGADWLCQYCGASNRTTDQFCTQCGAAKGSSPTQAVRTYALDEVPQAAKPVAKPPAPAKSAKSSGFRPFKGAIATCTLMLALGGGAWFVTPRSLQTTVDGVAWERYVNIEQYVTVTESDWSIPPGGRLLSQQQEIKSYQRILDRYETRTRQVSEQVATGTETYVCGQRDLGNGFFEDETCTRTLYETRTRTETYEEPIYRQEPIYATKYTYEIERWVHARTASTFGTDLNPHWAVVSLADNEREASREAKYTVDFIDRKGNMQQYAFNETDWSTFELGKACDLVFQYGRLRDVDCQ